MSRSNGAAAPFWNASRANDVVTVLRRVGELSPNSAGGKGPMLNCPMRLCSAFGNRRLWTRLRLSLNGRSRRLSAAIALHRALTARRSAGGEGACRRPWHENSEKSAGLVRHSEKSGPPLCGDDRPAALKNHQIQQNQFNRGLSAEPAPLAWSMQWMQKKVI